MITALVWIGAWLVAVNTREADHDPVRVWIDIVLVGAPILAAAIIATILVNR